jgi:hypothetical protein
MRYPGFFYGMTGDGDPVFSLEIPVRILYPRNDVIIRIRCLFFNELIPLIKGFAETAREILLLHIQTSSELTPEAV